MVFEKGNKLAVGTDNGVDKKYDREEYAAKLLEWAEKSSSIHIISFCAQHKLPGEYIGRWSKESDVFRQAVCITRAILADRQEYLLQTGRLEQKNIARMMGYYNSVLNEFERDEMAYEYGLKKGLESNREMPSKIEVVNYNKATND